MTKGKLITISGPSGVGKTTVAEKILSEHADTFSAVTTVTTRGPRLGEINGVDYHFQTRSEFLENLSAGHFLEHAEVFGNLYGTPKHGVQEVLARGKNACLIVDVQGAAQIREAMPEAITVFISPPSIGELMSRLFVRGTDTQEVIGRRIKGAHYELAQADKFSINIVNDKLDDAVTNIINDLKSFDTKLDINERDVCREHLDTPNRQDMQP